MQFPEHQKTGLITGYVGDEGEREVYIAGQQLYPRRSQELYNHSPDGFSWGYAGSGPSQLALAIVLHYCDERTAASIYQDFKREFIAPLDIDKGFMLEVRAVLDWIEKHTPNF